LVDTKAGLPTAVSVVMMSPTKSASRRRLLRFSQRDVHFTNDGGRPAEELGGVT
jgi:hypothetical protein